MTHCPTRTAAEFTIGLDYPQQRDVGRRIHPDDFHPVFHVIHQADPNLVRVLDDVVVGDDLASGGDKETRAGGPANLRLPFAAILAGTEEEVKGIVRHPAAVL